MAADLVAHSSARAVVVITTTSVARRLINATAQLVEPGTFNWIASDAWASFASRMTELGDMLIDTFVVDILTGQAPEFAHWYLQLTPVSRLHVPAPLDRTNMTCLFLGCRHQGVVEIVYIV